MKDDGINRREFLKGTRAGGAVATTAAAGWAAPALAQTQQKPAAPANPGYSFLNLEEAAFVEAVVDHMVPADEHKMGRHVAQVINDIAKSINPTSFNPASMRESWTVVPYQSTHNTGGTIMGTNPGNSVVNKYLQSWDCYNLFIMGAGVFPHNAAYNPTGPVGALAYWAADAIKNRYTKNPGLLV